MGPNQQCKDRIKYLVLNLYFFIRNFLFLSLLRRSTILFSPWIKLLSTLLPSIWIFLNFEVSVKISFRVDNIYRHKAVKQFSIANNIKPTQSFIKTTVPITFMIFTNFRQMLPVQYRPRFMCCCCQCGYYCR